MAKRTFKFELYSNGEVIIDGIDEEDEYDGDANFTHAERTAIVNSICSSDKQKVELVREILSSLPKKMVRDLLASG